MAGAGYKLFNTGDVLTAAQVNTYLNEQTVMVFASSAARTSALSGVLAEGMVSYLQDTNAVEVYNGTAWVGVSGAGDVTEVQAGTGISVASGTGPIPVVTNTMATAVDAKGDLIVGTGADTFARLAVGTNEQRLVADSAAATGLKYVADTTNYAVAAKGDLLVGTAADTVAVLSVGTNGHTLVADSSVSPQGLKWAVDPVADVITTAGDLIYGTAADTVTRLGIGTAGQVLKVNSGATAPEWGAAGGGASGLTFISRTTFSNVATQDIDPFDNTYETYLMIIENIYAANTGDDILIRGRHGSTVYTGTDYYSANAYIKYSSTDWTWANSNAQSSFNVIPQTNSNYPAQAAIYFNNVGDASKYFVMYGQWNTREGMFAGQIGGEIFSQQTWGGIRLLSSSGNITGEVSFYGLAKA